MFWFPNANERKAMLNDNVISIARQYFEELQQKVLAATAELYKNTGIAHDIANMVLLELGVETPDEIDLTAQISKSIAKASETYFSDLWMYCYRYALQLLRREELAQDIAQEAIASLFKTDKQVEYIKGWLKRTVFNQAQTKITELKRESSLELADFADLAAVEEPADEDSLETDLDPNEIRKYLSAEDFKLYTRIKAHRNLKVYAKAEKISYQTAREHKHRVLHNLKHNYLKKQGWQGTPQILSFRQMTNVKRFIKTLIEHAEENALHKLSKYCPKGVLEEVKSTLQNLKQASDWGINMLSNMKFEIFIFDFSEPSLPSMFTIQIRINQGNSIRILSSKQLNMMGTVDENILDVVPVESGKCSLSMNEIMLMIR